MDYFDSNAHITTSFQSAIWITKHSIEPTIKDVQSSIVGSNNAQNSIVLSGFESNPVKYIFTTIIN